jgi:TrmH family RNA methyltransferase
MEQITSRHNPLVTRLKKLGRDRSARRAEGVFLCEGVKLVEEAVRWGAPVEVLAVARGTQLPFAPPAGARLVELPGDVLAGISTQDSPQGVLAVCAAPPITPPERLESGRYLVLDGVQDPGNVGTIWRTADAFGAAGLILLPGCADPFSPKTARASMGACFRLPVWECGLERLTGLLAAGGMPLYATALGENTRDVGSVALTSCAVVIGSEGRGVSAGVLAACGQTLKIPMVERCESLNAAVAAAVVLWEGWRARAGG